MKSFHRSFLMLISIFLIFTSTYFSSNQNSKAIAASTDNTISVLQFEGNVSTISKIVEGTEIKITQVIFEENSDTWSYETWYNLIRSYDVILFPGGSSIKQYNSLGVNGRMAVMDYVKNGGNYMGICAGGFLASRQRLGLANVEYQKPYNAGSGTLEIKMESQANELFSSTDYNYPSKRMIKMVNGPVWALSSPNKERSPYNVLATFTGIGMTSNYEGATFKGFPAIISDHYGNGNIILFSAHPDLTSSLGNTNMLVESFRWLVNYQKYGGSNGEQIPETISAAQFEGNVDAIKKSVFGSRIEINEILFEDKGLTWKYEDWLDLFQSFDALIFPSDSAKKQYDGLGENGRKALKDYISNGGGYLGISSGAFLASKQKLNLLDAQYQIPFNSGVGELGVEMTNFANEIFVSNEYQSGSSQNMSMYNGPLWLNDVNPTYSIIANFSGTGSTSSQSGSAFLNKPAIISDTYGSGRVILFSTVPYTSYSIGTGNILTQAITWASNKKNTGYYVKAPIVTNEQEYNDSLSYDFYERDKIPQTYLPEDKWFEDSSWGPPATIYPEVLLPNGVDNVKWKRDRIIEVTKKYIGTPYNYRHIPILGLDCSNFTSWVYNYGLGIKFSSGIKTQSEEVGRKLLPDEKFEKGDLLFIYNLDKTSISHAVIFIDDSHIIDSTVDSIDGVGIRTFGGWYKQKLAFARRVIE